MKVYGVAIATTVVSLKKRKVSNVSLIETAINDNPITPYSAVFGNWKA